MPLYNLATYHGVTFFDFMDQVDEFILYDDVQFVKRHWRNRNKIKTSNGCLWLSIPVETKGSFSQDINEAMIADAWTKKHWRIIQNAYGKAPHFRTYGPMIEALYERAATLDRLSEVNRLFLGAATYDRAFRPLIENGRIDGPHIPDHCTTSGHMYYLLLRDLEERAAFIEHMKANQIHAVFHYVPLHNSPAGRKFGRAASSLPITENISERLVRLPAYLNMGNEINRVIERAMAFLR